MCVELFLARTEGAETVLAAVEAELGGTPGVAALAAARRGLAGPRRPVVIAGLEARLPDAAAALRRLVEALGAPALATYKAKGVVPDAHPCAVGMFTGGSAEAACVGQADAIVLAGLDPVELILQPWRYAAPVIDVALVRHPVHYVRAAASLHGPLAPALAALAEGAGPSAWTLAEIGAHREQIRAGMACPGGEVSPEAVVEIAREVAAARPLPRVTVDAGAHMFSVMAFWQAAAPCDVLISNGLSTMAFALPAAVAAALHEPGRRVLAFTGDGGLLMCLGELATAAQQRVPLTVVVFNDGSLSLIDVRQQARRLDPRGVRWDRLDFARVAEGLGLRAWRVDTTAACRAALAAALDAEGPSLIDVRVDPSGYRGQLRALRG